MKDENENEIEELETPVPPVEEVKEEIAEQLTDAELEKKITTIVDEKIELANTSTDDEEDETLEDEEDEGQSIGLFPFVLIGGVVLVSIASIFLQNKPDISPISNEEQSHG